MNRIDFNLTGGFPLSTQILEALQAAYKDFNQYGNLAGDNLVIIAGCDPGAGGTVTDGFVFINGELLPFVGTTVTAKVIIVETQDARGFEDGSVKPVIYKRYATFGAGGTEFTWIDFRRPKTLFQLEDRLTQLEKAVPIGLVAIWGKPADAIPEGWEEYINLAGKVPVGHESGDPNFGSLDNAVGVKEVTLTLTQIPAHSHEQGSESLYSDFTGGTLVGNRNYPNDGSSTPSYRNQNTSSKGGGLAHTNIQPSRIVKFIRFVGF